MQARWLKYSHECGRSWDLQRRGEEEAEKARAAFEARSRAPEPQGQEKRQPEKQEKRQEKERYRQLFSRLYS
jgi:hypothetical protein